MTINFFELVCLEFGEFEPDPRKTLKSVINRKPVTSTENISVLISYKLL